MIRKLASIQKITSINPIPNADAIEVATVGGWDVVVKKGEYCEDIPVVYLEIDSWVPHSLAPFLTKPGHQPKVYNGIEGQRLRTVKLRGQLSQGLILPMTVLANGKNNPELWEAAYGYDVTEHLDIQKWEPVIAVHLQGKQKGNFPHFIPKTDQERAQNLTRTLFGEPYDNNEYEVTVKLDGSSMTIFSNKETGEIGVCSRNINLELEQEGNTFVDTAKRIGIIDALMVIDGSYAVQGELMGPGIQGNRESLAEYTYFVYDIYDIHNKSYLSPSHRTIIFEELRRLGANILHVPVIEDYFHLYHDGGINDMTGLLSYAEGPSLVNSVREGLVFKAHNSEFSFKVISNKFLLSEG